MTMALLQEDFRLKIAYIVEVHTHTLECRRMPYCFCGFMLASSIVPKTSCTPVRKRVFGS